MEYSIRELSEMAGVSARTLRYYDEIGLLAPSRVSAAGYRFYGQKEVELLQQILYYRERGLELQRISEILYQETFDVKKALLEHLLELEQQQRKTERLILNLKNTIASMKGDYDMSDQERFEAFKQDLVQENEKLYGTEAWEKYGKEAIDESNRRLLKMTEEDYQKMQKLDEDVRERLEAAVRQGKTAGSEEMKEVVRLHREWLCMTWKTYSPEAHKGLGTMYTMDERFRDYYDRNVSGCAALLNEAIGIWAL